jgi:hypothetical protein
MEKYVLENNKRNYGAYFKCLFNSRMAEEIHSHEPHEKNKNETYGELALIKGLLKW